MKKMLVLKRFTVLALVMLLSFGLYACQNLLTTTQLPTPESVGNFSNYDELKSYLSNYYDEAQNNVYLYRNSDMLAESALDGAAITTTASIPSANSEDSKTYSETNNQVDGVFESDRILTDGYYIYVISNSHFYIIDADSLQIVFTYTYENGYLIGMYRYNDRIVVISSEYSYEESTDAEKADGYYTYWYSYSYGIRINVFDTSDMENVNIAKSMYFDSASIVDSRMIDGTVYLILDNYAIYYGFTEDDFVPEYQDSTIGEEVLQVAAQNIYYMPNDNNSFGYLLLISFNVADDSGANVKAYLGSSYQIFMSLDNLYTIIYRYAYDEETQIYTQDTYILRFQIVDNELVYQACGKVSGMPLNQFSMDEYDGVFRIATTGYNWTQTSTEVNNQIYLLDATSVNEMTQIGYLGDLGKPGERIYAVRYSEAIAYVVTFVNTDPMYKIDLSDPANPAVIGELYEEGVSDYLHELTDSIMIGVGRQAVTEGGWTHFTGVKVSLYDTTGNDPVSLETYFVEGEYSYSPVIYDHKAFVSYTPTDANFTYVVIPVYEYSELWYHSSQSAYVFKVYFSGDLEFVTKLSHMDENSENPYYYYFDSIERTIMIEDRIYTVSYTKIQMYDMSNNFNLLGSTQLEEDYYYYIYGTAIID